MRSLLLLVGLASLLLPSRGLAEPPATKAAIEAEVASIRKEFLRVEDMVEKGAKLEAGNFDDEANQGKLKTASVTLGGGQNPNEFQVSYLGPTNKSFEKDPYATAFGVRRIVLNRTLPAVGLKKDSYYYLPDGKLFFVHQVGQEKPLDELRVYFRDGAPFRVVFTDSGAEKDQGVATFDLPLMSDKKQQEAWRKAALNLQKSGKALFDAFALLGK
jgi:hypothetical protein